MINKRILVFGLIAILAISIVKLGTDLVKENIMGKEADELEIVRSDGDDIVLLDDGDMRKTVMYFQNGDGYLVPVMKQIPWDEGIAKATLSNMVDSGEIRESLIDTGLSAIIPTGTIINGISINEETGVCKVDFNGNILNTESKEDEENLIKGIVYTLTEFPRIKEVQIMVEGKILPKLKHGSPVSEPIGRENINTLGDLSKGKSNVVVYFIDDSEEEFNYYIPVTIPTMAPVTNVGSALDVLFQGPPELSGLRTDIPKDISLGGVEIKDGTAFVDISTKVGDGIDDEKISLIMKNIGLTLGEFKEIENVEIFVDGKVVNTAVPVFANEY